MQVGLGSRSTNQWTYHVSTPRTELIRNLFPGTGFSAIRRMEEPLGVLPALAALLLPKQSLEKEN